MIGVRSAMFMPIILFVLVFPSFEATVHGEEKGNYYTLERGVLEALSNNWGIKTKKEGIEGARYVKDQAKADFLPKLSTSYGYTRMDEAKMSDPIPLGGGLVIPGRPLNPEDNYQWRSSIRQPLFTGFALLSTYELARLGVDRSEMELELEKLDLILKVKEAYFNILRADISVEVVQREVESRESHLEVAKNFYDVGIIPINDLLKAEVEIANSRQNLVKAQNASKLARSVFNNVLARPVNLPVEVEVEKNLAFRPERVDFEEAMDKALKHRPEVNLVDLGLLQSDQQIRLARSKYYPDITLTYDYIKEGDEYDVSGSEFHDSSQWQAMAVLSWTFWEWGKTNSAVREKESLKKQLTQTRASLVENISLELKQAALELDQAEKNIPPTKKAVEQAEENLRVNEERYKAQVTTMTEVLDAESLLTQARRNYYSALIDHQLAKARLQRAMGEN